MQIYSKGHKLAMYKGSRKDKRQKQGALDEGSQKVQTSNCKISKY